MFTRSVEVAIDRPIDEVFAFVSDARNRPSTSGPFPTTLVYRLDGDGGRTSVEFSVTGRPSGRCA